MWFCSTWGQARLPWDLSHTKLLTTSIWRYLKSEWNRVRNFFSSWVRYFFTTESIPPKKLKSFTNENLKKSYSGSVWRYLEFERKQNFFLIPNFHDTDSDTVLYQKYSMPYLIPSKKCKSFETETSHSADHPAPAPQPHPGWEYMLSLYQLPLIWVE